MLNTSDTETENEAPTIKPDWHAVAFDQTYAWNIAEEDKPFIEKMLGVYFFNKNERTNCCELTPSYWFHFLHNIAVTTSDCPENVRERISERYEMSPDDDGGFYAWCSRIKDMETVAYGPIDDDETEDDIREYWQGNWPF